jgi:CheY-like chemotaxis protein
MTNGSPSVLVVVESEEECSHYVQSLRREGVIAIGAGSVAGAQALLKALIPTLVLVELSGTHADDVAAIRAIRGHVTAPTRLVAMSAYTTDDVIARAVSAGADVFIGKPIGPADVAREIARLLLEK